MIKSLSWIFRVQSQKSGFCGVLLSRPALLQLSGNAEKTCMHELKPSEGPAKTRFSVFWPDLWPLTTALSSYSRTLALVLVPRRERLMADVAA